MKTILFQGDSITDAGRSRENDENMGVGYPTMVAGELGYENPGEYRFLNRGISGNRSVDLYARIKSDIICLKPDVMSILIGVNDVWHELDNGNGVDGDKYFMIYSLLLKEIKEALPLTKIMILEPFVLKASATEENWDVFRAEVEIRAEKARQVAEEFQLPFVSLQKKFDQAAKLAKADFWLRDGVHPTVAGHELIKREWIRTFNSMEK